MAVDFYSTSVIREVRSSFGRKENWLVDMFFKKKTTVSDENIILELKKGHNNAAPFISDVENGRVIKEKGRVSNVIKAPSIGVETPLTAKDVFMRVVGGSQQGGLTLAQRYSNRVAEILAEQERAIVNKEELIVAQFLTTGKVTSLDGEHPVEIDYQMPTIETLTAGNKWGEANVDIFGSIRKYVDNAEKKSGEVVNTVVIGERSAGKILNNPDLDKRLDVKNKSEAILSVIAMYPGIRYLGRLDGKIDIFSFNKQITNAKNEVVDLIPANIMIGGPTDGEMLFAPIIDFEEEAIYEEMRHTRNTVSKTGKQKVISTESRPVLQPLDLSAYFSVVVCD